MKLTGNLKKQVEQAAGREEARRLIEQAGIELTDDELEMVAGGAGKEDLNPAQVFGNQAGISGMKRAETYSDWTPSSPSSEIGEFLKRNS